jgi:hypothetical protein
MTVIRIGADELILWLRKNNKAADVPNEGFQGLGDKILALIISLGGSKVEDGVTSYWASGPQDKNIGTSGLPKSSAQYEINTSALEQLYDTLNNW